MERVEAWPVWEFECPKCASISRLDCGDFIDNETEHSCEDCQHEFFVEHD